MSSTALIYAVAGLVAVLALSYPARHLRGASEAGSSKWVVFGWLGLRFAIMAAVALLLSGSLLAVLAGLDFAGLLFRAAILVLLTGSVAMMASTAALNIALAIRGPSPGSP